MKQPKCRLCGFEHGLSEAHVFTRSYSESGSSEACSSVVERLSLKAHEVAGSTPVTPAKPKSGGKAARRAKASGPVTPKPFPEKTADEVVPPIKPQAQSAEPSHETDYPAWRRNYLRLKAQERRRAKTFGMTIFEYRKHLAGNAADEAVQ